jgi:hypothetical protein
LLLYDDPRRLTLTVRGQLSGNLDQLPEYQNVMVDVKRLFTATGDLSYSNVRSSLGSVDDEAGQLASVELHGDRVNGASFLRVHGTYDFGVPLPLAHSSVWLRTAVGASPQDRAEPFANFYFGGFGNNYVDYHDEKRYREYSSLPGASINEIGGRNFVKSTAEWNLPPVRFSRAGRPGLYASWLRPAVFVTGVTTNVDDGASRHRAASVGGQFDVRLTALATVNLTLSAGAAVVVERGHPARREAMASLTVLR